MERLSNEQVHLVNEIWNMLELLDNELAEDVAKSLEVLKIKVMEDDVVLPDHKLRAVLLELKTAHRKGAIKQIALVP